MYTIVNNIARMKVSRLFAVAALGIALAPPAPAIADEDDAKRILKSMSDFMASQTAVSFDFDSTLGVITADGQRLALASSGSLALERPNKLMATRAGGFADVEFRFDGSKLVLFGKTANVFLEVPIEGSIDDLVETLRVDYDRPVPAGDLLISNSYDGLMEDVTDIKDLGSGVINGVECDYLAFRTEDVDWQIWIAHGDQPYPCRYVITSSKIKGSPQYSIQTRNWKMGSDVGAVDASFANDSGAKQVAAEDLKDAMSDLPQHFKLGAE